MSERPPCCEYDISSKGYLKPLKLHCAGKTNNEFAVANVFSLSFAISVSTAKNKHKVQRIFIIDPESLRYRYNFSYLFFPDKLKKQDCLLCVPFHECHYGFPD